MAAPESKVRETAPYQLFMLVLSVYVLIELALETVVHIDSQALTILLWADTLICGVFFIDFLRSLKRAPNKKRYMLTWGWIDLLSSIPAAPFLRWGRAARVVRVLRILRAVRSARILGQFVLARRADTTMLGAVLLGIVAMVTASVTVLQYEAAAAGSIVTPGDALWWSLVTVTSVGYGDMVPVTPQGRGVAMALMTIGVLLFGTMTAYLATWFTRPQEESQDRELATIRSELAVVRTLLERVAGGGAESTSEKAGSRIGVSAAEDGRPHTERAVIAAPEVRASG